MIDSLDFWWQMRGLRRRQRRTEKLYAAEIAEARRKKKPGKDIENLINDRKFEVEMIDDEIWHLTSRRLVHLAARYFLPTPDYDNWEQSISTGFSYLQPEAMHELRNIVRKEQNERCDQMLKWISALTGIVGALTGLVAVIGAS